MEDTSRDSAPKVPVKEKRVPCSVVVFNSLTAIPGTSTMYTEIRAGAKRIAEGKEFELPMPFLDPNTRSIWISGREYPLERVHYWERAKTAFVKPAPDSPHDYVVGKKAKRVALTPPSTK